MLGWCGPDTITEKGQDISNWAGKHSINMALLKCLQANSGEGVMGHMSHVSSEGAATLSHEISSIHSQCTKYSAQNIDAFR